MDCPLVVNKPTPSSRNHIIQSSVSVTPKRAVVKPILESSNHSYYTSSVTKPRSFINHSQSLVTPAALFHHESRQNIEPAAVNGSNDDVFSVFDYVTPLSKRSKSDGTIAVNTDKHFAHEISDECHHHTHKV